MPPYRGLWGERTSPGGGLSVRKDSSSGGRLLHDVFRVQDWALHTVVQRQGVSFRRIARAARPDRGWCRYTLVSGTDTSLI